MKKYLSILLVAILLVVPNYAWAAWGAQDDLETYSVADLDGNSGGSGWATNWADAGLNWDVVETGAIGGTRSAKITENNSGTASRTFTSTASGQFSIQLKALTTGNHGYVQLYDTATFRGRLSIGGEAAGSLKIFNGAAWTDVDTFSADTAFTVEFDFGGRGGVCTSLQYRARKDAGTWSSCISMEGGAADVNKIAVEYGNAAGRALTFDDIIGTGDDTPAPAVSVIEDFINFWQFFEF